MRKTSRTAALAAAAVLAITGSVAGCTAQPAASDRPARTNAADTQAPTTTTTPPRPVDLPPVTPPGTSLTVGQPAVLPAGGTVAPDSLVEVTATLDSRPITDAEIQRLPLNEENKAQLRGKVFIFIRTGYVNLTGADLTDMETVLLFPHTRSGGWPGALMQLGTEDLIADCASQRPDEALNQVGAKHTNCEPHFGVAEDPVVSLVYDDPPYSEAAPLTWRVG
jgi:hypothetical protein